MKKLLKENLKMFVAIIITAVVATTTTIFAYSLVADEVGFTPHDSNWNVQDVDAALNNLNLRTNQLDTNFSTEEQVVGRWIDNKTIYQRTFVCTSAFNFSNNVWFSLNNAFSGITSEFVKSIDTLVDARVKIDKGYVNPMWVLANYPSSGTLGGYSFTGNGFYKDISTITIQYTKTTD